MSIRYLSGINVDNNVLFVDDANNRVGIGTGSPTTALDVNGTISVGGSPIAWFSGNYNRIFRPNGTVGIYLGNATDAGNYYDNTTHYFRSSGGGTTYAVINNLGNVGIGTTAPAYKLDVNGGFRVDGTNGDFIVDANGNDIYFTRNGTNYFYGNQASSSFAFYTNSNLGLFQSSAGNVGIGTTSPQSKLSVYGSGGATGVTLTLENGGAISALNDPLGIINFYSNDSSISSSGTFGSLAVRNEFNGNWDGNVNRIDTYMAFSTSSNAVLSERVRITSDGNVGIGTTSPATTLQVNATSPAIRLQETGSGGDKRLELSVNSSGVATIAANQSAQVLTFETVGSERMRIASTGATRLNAYGSGSFTGTVAYNLAVDSSGNVIETAGGVVDGSGTANYVSKWSDANTLTDSQLFDNGTSVGIGTASLSASYRLTISGSTYQVGTDSKIYVDNGGVGGASAILGVIGTSYGYLNTDGPYPFVFQTNNTERMRITSAGNVGIGTTSPGYSLDVAGTSRSDLHIFRSNQSAPTADAFIFRPADNTVALGTANAERMRVTSVGNVGIGTTSPSALLHVATASTTGTTSMLLLSRASGYGHTLFEQIYDSTYFTAGKTLTLKNDSGTAFAHFAGNNAGTRTDLLIPTGNVGIGTNAPITELEILSSAYDGITMSRTAQSGGTYIQGRSHDTSNVLRTAGRIVFGATAAANAADGFITFNTYSADTENERMRVTATGNVGIGTTAPNAKLNVNTNAMGVTVSDSSGISLTNGTAAAAGAQQMSPTLRWSGQGWATTPLASRNVSFISFLTPQQGTTNPSGILNFASSINGGAYSSVMSLTTGGALTITAGFSATSGTFTSTINNTISGLATTPTDGIVTVNGTAATAGVPVQISPRLRISGTAWNTGGTPASNTMNWTIDNLSTSGNPPTSALRFNFDRNGGGYSTLVSFISNGNVGIGTTAPSQRLEVSGSAAGDFAALSLTNTNQSGTADASTINFKLGRTADSFLFTIPAIKFVKEQQWTGTASTVDGALTFSTILDETVGERLRITSAGNVGIGTTSPAQKLTVSGSTGDILGITNGTTTGYGYVDNNGFGLFTSSGAGGTGIYYRTANIIDHYVNGSIAMRLNSTGNVGINNTAPTARLDIVGDSAVFKVSSVTADTSLPTKRLAEFAGIYNSGANGHQMFISSTSGLGSWEINQTKTWGGIMTFGVSTNSTEITRHLAIDSSGNVGIGNTAPTQKLHVSGNIRVTGAYYDSSNSAGSSGQVLSSTGSGTAWVNQGEATATSLFDLLPSARTTYAWSVQLTAGTWADIFSSNTVLSNGTWMVQVYVDDFAVGGQQYQETYSGIMSWGSASSTNEIGPEAISEIILHRSGHAANTGNFYLRTVERASSTLLLQGMSNQTYSAASTINFKFVKIF